MKEYIHIPLETVENRGRPRPHSGLALACILFFLCQTALCLPAPAPAATVNFESGSANSVVGNDGIGGTGSTPVNNPNASGNTVNVTGGTVNNGIYGGVHSNNTGVAANASGNEVNVGPAFTGNISNLYVYGGFSRVQASGSLHIGKSATAYGNTVNIGGGSFSQIFGGYAGSENGPAKADNNTVSFTSGTVTDIYGGYAVISALSSAYAASASGNHVIISGGTVTDAVYGGQTNRGASGNATNNTVTITGAPTLTTARLFGGNVTNTASSDAWSGNTLELKTSGITVASVGGFQNFHFYVPDSVGNQDTLLTVTGTANISGSTVRVAMSGNNSPLQIGDTVTLIDAGVLSGTPANNGGTALGVQGISKIFTFEINADTGVGEIVATVLSVEASGDGGQVDTQFKSLGESRVAGLELLNQGQYMLDALAVPQLRSLAPHTPCPVAFGVMGGSAMRYHSGSHVDVESFSLITGLGWNAPPGAIKNGNLLLGAFFEAGWGNYDAYNSFGNTASIKGGGNTRHHGGGILARYDTAPLNFFAAPGNLYLEASARFGQVETDYSSSDFLTASGNNVAFESSSAYSGAHAGLGYIWSITGISTLDLYTKCLWTRQSSDSVTIEGDSILFKGMNSRRWRTGARLNNVLNADSGLVFTQYAGAACEYEFDAKAGASSNGEAIAAPDMKGGTGMGELGVVFKPSATSGLSIGLGAQLYLGKRTGGGGTLQAKWAF